MRIVPLPKNATPEQVAERKAHLAEWAEISRVYHEEEVEERLMAPIEKAVRRDKAIKQLKKVGLDHLVDL